MAISLGQQTEYGPGSFETKEIKIIGEGGEIDITNFVEEFIMSESIYSNCIRGSITMADGLNIMANLPITEGDIVHIHYTPNSRDEIMMEVDPDGLIVDLEIIKVSVQRRFKQDAQIYVLQLASCTWSENIYSKISKSYEQTTYDTMVQEIYDMYCTKGGLKGLMPTKPLETIPPDGLWNVVIPGWKPYQFFNWVSGKAYQGPWADYAFWEDADKFNWAPITYLKSLPEVATYYPGVQNIEPIHNVASGEFEKNYFQLEDYEIKQSNDVSTYGLRGIGGVRLLTHDIVRKMVKDYYITGPFGENYEQGEPRSYNDEFGAVEHVDGAREKLLRDSTIEKLGVDPGNSKFAYAPIHFEQWDTMPEFKPENWLRQHEVQMSSNHYLKMEASAVGNFARRVGDKIKIELPSLEWQPKDQEVKRPEYDSRLRGNWLIVSLRRIFHKHKWHLKLELIKDNYYGYKPNHIWEDADKWDVGSEK